MIAIEIVSDFMRSHTTQLLPVGSEILQTVVPEKAANGVQISDPYSIFIEIAIGP